MLNHSSTPTVADDEDEVTDIESSIQRCSTVDNENDESTCVEPLDLSLRPGSRISCNSSSTEKKNRSNNVDDTSCLESSCTKTNNNDIPALWSTSNFLGLFCFDFFLNYLTRIFDFLGFVNRECENLREALQKASNLENCLVLNTPSTLINVPSVTSSRVSPSVTATESVNSDSGIDGISSAASHQSESSSSSTGSSIWPSPSNLISQYSMVGTNGLLDLQRVLEVCFNFNIKNLVK